MKYPHLFTPLAIRDCLLPNRIMSTAAVFRLAAEDGHVTKEITERYQRMARGGLGAIVVEAAVVLPSRSSFNLRVSDDTFLPELRAFVKAIREANPAVKIGLQNIHFLKVARSGWRQKVEDLTPEDIAAIPGMFAGGAARTKAAGFDFVEIHMAHFTTLASFLSLVNKRQDRYGGDFEGRVRLPLEVVRAVREAVGDYPVGLRMNGEEFTKEGNTLLQSARLACRLAAEGVDYISVSAGERFEDAPPPPEGFPPFAGTGYSGYRMSPRWWAPDGVQVYLADGIRQALRAEGYTIPVVTAGKIRMPDLAEEILEEGRADVVGMARTILADPDWPQKAREGRDADIVKCAACGWCSESDERYETVLCIQWPKGTLNAPEPWLFAPPCHVACPAGVDVRTYIELIGQGQYERALEVIEEKIPLPGVIGRVCPRPCETQCNRASFDGTPVAIDALKRYVADAVTARGKRKIEAPARTQKERIAVVGSGPAGLSAAAYLAKLGYGTTVFEAGEVAGGMLAFGIPAHRLPRDILNDEIARIKELGVEVRLNAPIGPEGLRLADLRAQGYSAIFLAVGAQGTAALDVPGTEARETVDGLSWLKDVNLGRPVRTGEKVVVVGGGNVAVDAARTALRLGARTVTVAYRRSEEEMPAIPGEVEEAEREGIHFRYLAAPRQVVLGPEGACVGLECLATSLGEPDESGRRRPVPVPGSEFVLDADLVITAVGQTPDLSFLAEESPALDPKGTLKVDPVTLATSLEGVFAGGDVVSGPATVVEALAAGRRAALSIDRYLHGAVLEEGPAHTSIPYEAVDADMFRPHPREDMPCLPGAERAGSFREVELGFDASAAQREVGRCLQCGMFPKK
jgi:NADPH-dependent glutamate synthase beta subunit-like oxidoreductase/2,4-dienoyl-CoA reductase-like NADH-dependent reductase (Old Yellow Enzyme family)